MRALGILLASLLLLSNAALAESLNLRVEGMS